MTPWQEVPKTQVHDDISQVRSARTALRGLDGSGNSTQSRAKAEETSRTRGMPRAVRTFPPRSLMTRMRTRGLTLRSEMPDSSPVTVLEARVALSTASVYP